MGYITPSPADFSNAGSDLWRLSDLGHMSDVSDSTELTCIREMREGSNSGTPPITKLSCRIQ